MTPLLLVEDHAELRRGMVDTLTEAGYSVATAVDGVAALNALRTTSPALVLLDLMLPRMSGWEFLEACQADPSLRCPPVIAVSSIRALNDYARLLGVAAYVAKPFDATELIAAIESVLGGVQAGDDAALARELRRP